MTALLLSMSLLAANPGGWEVRYGQHGDQKPEWTAAGKLPAWALTFSPDGREITWVDDATGGCRGWLLLGRRMTLPDPLPAGVRVSLDYRTACVLEARSGMLDAFVMTAEAWESLAVEPGQAGLLDRGALPGWAAFTTVKTQGDDANDWTLSGPHPIRLPKRARAGEQVVVGVAWACYHYEQDEHGGVRNVEVAMVGAEEEEQRFWAALDTDRPELEAVKQALAVGDRAAAGAALA
ncbi:MAG: hypothetical protein HYU66_04480, partial [Armatimonadetes bacterium]|nr:hypothetical protein [Armatimonadota bacterium]